MLTKNILNQPKSLVEVTVTVPWADLESLWNQTLQRMAQDVEIAGFRKGQAPLNLVEQQLGQRLQDEFLKSAMPNFLIEALKGTDIIPIDYPKYDLVSFVKGQPLQYKATITNRPQVSVGNYKIIKVSKPTPKVVTDEEVQKVVDDLFKKWKTRQPVQGGSATTAQPSTAQQSGGQGSISFQQGNQITQSPSAPRNDVSGNGQADIPASPTGGQGGPDDTFAKAMGATSVQDLKDKIKKDLEANVSYNNELDYEEAILQEVEKITTVELPEVLIQDELNRMLVSLQRRVADMGLLLDDYLRTQGKTLDQIKNEWRAQAEKNVRMELGLADIARQENVIISDQDLQAEIDKIQDLRIKQQFASQEPRLQLRHALRQTKTLDLLKRLVGG